MVRGASGVPAGAWASAGPAPAAHRWHRGAAGRRQRGEDRRQEGAAARRQLASDPRAPLPCVGGPRERGRRDRRSPVGRLPAARREHDLVRVRPRHPRGGPGAPSGVPGRRRGRGGAVDPGPAGGPLARAEARRLLHLQSLAEAPPGVRRSRRRSRSIRRSRSCPLSPSSGSPRTAPTAAPSGASRWTSPTWRASCSWPASSARTSPSSRAAAEVAPVRGAGLAAAPPGRRRGDADERRGAVDGAVQRHGLRRAGASRRRARVRGAVERDARLPGGPVAGHDAAGLPGARGGRRRSWAGGPARRGALPSTPARTPVPRTTP